MIKLRNPLPERRDLFHTVFPVSGKKRTVLLLAQVDGEVMLSYKGLKPNPPEEGAGEQ